MMNAFKKLLAITAAITMWAVIQPGTLAAQTSGIGGDGWTRLMWRGTDSSISLWKVDPNLKNPMSHQYGPYDGWVPIAITTANNSYTYVLWRHTNGTAQLWLVDPKLNFITNKLYGPFTGWIAESLSANTTSGDNTFRLIWRETNGSAGVWALDSGLTGFKFQTLGPVPGFNPGSAAAALNPSASGPADAKAAAAMGTNSSPTIPVPK
jgi:hypothetical protein